METYIGLKCERCGEEYSKNKLVLKCERCGGVLKAVYNYELARERIEGVFGKPKESIWSYSPLLPLNNKELIVSMGEGVTPVVKCVNLAERVGLRNLYIKNETLNPTGTFKDRAASVAMTKAREFALNKVACHSSGNAGCAAAAYTARAGMKLVVFCPHFAPRSKLKQIQIYGGILALIESDFADDMFKATKLVVERHGWYPFGTLRITNPYQWEGTKTAAFEICEQFNFNPPEWIIVPMGGGGNISSIWEGFKEFYEMGLINELPRMVGIQPSGCSPIVEAFKEKRELKPWSKSNTIVESLIVLYSPDGEYALKALRESRGVAESVSDEEILKAEAELASLEGIFAEPAGAASIAGLKKLVEDGVVDKGDRVLCLVTGVGFKQLEVVDELIGEPFRVKPTPESIDELIKQID